MVAHFEPVVDANCRLVDPPPTRQTAIGGYPKVASYDMLGEQLHYSNPVKHGWRDSLSNLICFHCGQTLSCHKSQTFLYIQLQIDPDFHKTNNGGKFNARALQQYAAFVEAMQYVIPMFTHKSYFFGIHLLCQNVCLISGISSLIVISCNFLKSTLKLPISSECSLSGICSG